MLRAKQQFDESFLRVTNIHSLYKHLKNDLHFQSNFLDDLLRSEIVYIISALDKFIHDIVRVGILESQNGFRPTTPALNNFSINMAQMNLILHPTTSTNINSILENVIIENHKHLSFQDPDKISQALSLIWLENYKWQKIAALLGMNESNVKIELRNIVIRRNQIVHEADLDLFTNTIQNIMESDVENSINFVNNLVNTIYSLVKI
jgi:hypothetical protein